MGGRMIVIEPEFNRWCWRVEQQGVWVSSWPEGAELATSFHCFCGWVSERGTPWVARNDLRGHVRERHWTQGGQVDERP